MAKEKKYPEQLVFGLDIGTRSIVGTVGYKSGDKFHIVAQCNKEHETRAMLDGQIHDIGKVAASIKVVKKQLEDTIGVKLHNVCIAAAGRVLKTISVQVEEVFNAEREVMKDDVYALSSKGIEKAYEEFNALPNHDDVKFYCVGYSVVRYFLNDYPMGNLENHSAKKIGAELIATFLPDDVVDGLYKAVELADLQVINMTLEPIAAIGLAIPEMYRMLNIALVDVGAGTSDISITKDGTITAFGMIPIAGDALTEAIAKHCLVDFNTAEMIKRQAEDHDVITYQDIMGFEMSISKEELLKVVEPIILDMTVQVSDKIKELNGDKSVSAVFVVGGGGRIPGYTDKLSEALEIAQQRVGVRGEQVMQNVVFENSDLPVDSLLVTPIGICLSFYEQSNNFIYVSFNDKRVKLYDNGKLSVVDAALQAQFANEDLFPKRGPALKYTVNGVSKMTRGQLGEAAVIMVNGSVTDLNAPIKNNDQIKVVSSTAGDAACITIGQLTEFGATMDVMVNDQKITLPKFSSVNGSLQSEYYEIQNGDDVTLLDYYTVKQITEFMDVIPDANRNIYVNNKLADMDTAVYANFSVVWSKDISYAAADVESFEELEIEESEAREDDLYASGQNDYAEDANEDAKEKQETPKRSDDAIKRGPVNTLVAEDLEENKNEIHDLHVIVNNQLVTLKGKAEYVYVDVFSYIDFDLSKPQGSAVITLLNTRPAQYMEVLHERDVLTIYWEGANK